MKKSAKALLITTILTTSIPAHAESRWYQLLLKVTDYGSAWAGAVFGMRLAGAYHTGVLGENIKKKPFLFGAGIGSYIAALCLGAPNKKYREVPLFLLELRNKVVRGEEISEFDIAQATVLKIPNAPKPPHLHPDIQALVGQIRQYNSTRRPVQAAGELPYDANDQQVLLQGIQLCLQPVNNRTDLYFFGCLCAAAGFGLLNSVIGDKVSTALHVVTTVKQ